MTSAPVDRSLAAPWHVRAHERSREWVAYFAAACEAVRQGLWLGVLDAGGLQDVTDYHYRSMRTDTSDDLNYFSDRHNLRGLFAWEQTILDTHFADCASVLIGAAGGGREALGLARRGVTVAAFDCNEGLVESCRSFLAAQGVDAQVFVAAPNDVPPLLGTYDGAILGLGSYTHIVGRQPRIRFLKAMRGRLRPGAPMMLSFRIYVDSRSRRLTYRLARIIRMMRGAEAVERGDAISIYFMHLFTEGELRDELASAGFDLVSCTPLRLAHAVARARPDDGESTCRR